MGVFCRYIRTGYDWLWFSVVVSICCKEKVTSSKFCDEGGEHASDYG